MKRSHQLFKIRVQTRLDNRIERFIYRYLYTEPLGNFCVTACRFQGNTHLVKSTLGDVTDPFRVNEEYFQHLFINDWEVCRWKI